MSKASEQAYADLQYTRNVAHVTLLREAVDHDEDVLTHVLRNVATVLTERADHAAADRRKAWQTTERALRAAADAVIDLQMLRTAHAAPAVAREPIDLSDPAQRKPAPGVPSERGAADIAAGSNGATADGNQGGYVTPRTAAQIRASIDAAGPDTDAKLAAAFDPPAVPALPVHIRTFPADPADPLGSAVNWCTTTGGPAGPRADATCASCIVEHDAAVRPLLAPPGAQAAIAEVQQREYAVGDTVTVGGIEFIKHSEFDPGDGGQPVTVLGAEVPPTVVLVTGSRGWTDAGVIHDTLAGLHATAPGLIIRHGDCRSGADAIAAAWCDAHGVAQQRRPADWNSHGKAAGPIRNAQMLVEAPYPSTFVAFWDGVSRGTADMIDRCRAAGVEGTIYGSTALVIPPPAVELVDPVSNRVSDRPDRRMTFDEVRRHGLSRRRGEAHRSHSQLTAWEDCGTRYAISDYDATPAWWFVGGQAVHARIEEINRDQFAMGDAAIGPTEPDAGWSSMFDRVVAEAEWIAGVPHEAWRAAAKGSEAYDFWRVTGQECTTLWSRHLEQRYRDGWRIMTMPDGEPGIEWRHALPLSADGSTAPDETIVDLVMIHNNDRTIEIIDFKAGRRPPGDGFQLATYAWSVWHALTAARDPRADHRITASYWMARTGTLAGPHDPRVAYPWESVAGRFIPMDVAERQGLYPARPSMFCRSCGVYDLCPAQSSPPPAPPELPQLPPELPALVQQLATGAP